MNVVFLINFNDLVDVYFYFLLISITTFLLVLRLCVAALILLNPYRKICECLFFCYPSYMLLSVQKTKFSQFNIYVIMIKCPNPRILIFSNIPDIPSI